MGTALSESSKLTLLLISEGTHGKGQRAEIWSSWRIELLRDGGDCQVKQTWVLNDARFRCRYGPQPRWGRAQSFSGTTKGVRSYLRESSTTCVLVKVGEGGKRNVHRNAMVLCVVSPRMRRRRYGVRGHWGQGAEGNVLRETQVGFIAEVRLASVSAKIREVEGGDENKGIGNNREPCHSSIQFGSEKFDRVAGMLIIHAVPMGTENSRGT
ncbi:uncharacterized protein EI90DRAFT_253547 [Cantharellus anzutake]|uniref:uncharacterized protein n=1 Tax=Cantharellus anzutake TaxID=1750568 RepID=UPI00190402D0|nr:uncharacterized protein EI90DRAFT_253547 [Cantharellus anzutake]KAF8335759.1 hypothetical protein EI90DRAFT_253547 [Cantharellus anzutake]